MKYVNFYEETDDFFDSLMYLLVVFSLVDSRTGMNLIFSAYYACRNQKAIFHCFRRRSV